MVSVKDVVDAGKLIVRRKQVGQIIKGDVRRSGRRMRFEERSSERYVEVRWAEPNVLDFDRQRNEVGS